MKQNIITREDRNLEIIMGNLLRVGVITAALFVLFGGILYLIHHGFSLPNYKTFKGEPSYLKNISGIFTNIFSFKTGAIIQFGLILLIATPVARVAFSVIAFLYEKDYMYTVFTLIVLSVLLYSFFAGV